MNCQSVHPAGATTEQMQCDWRNIIAGLQSVAVECWLKVGPGIH